MSKWIWRIFNPDEHHNLWFKLLRAKYFNVDNIFARNSQGGSQFWRSLHKIKHLFKLGAKFTPGNGEKIFFWTDWWQGEGPLALRFPRLFDICSSKTITVAQAFPISPAAIQFRRSFGLEEVQAWERLVQELHHTNLSAECDQVSWALEPHGKFTVSSLYRKINQGPSLPHEKLLWKSKLPLKIKIFLWQMAKGKMPVNEQIHRRHGRSNGQCALCGQMESINHIFFSCVFARLLWSGIREAFGVQWNPTSLADFLVILQQLTPIVRQAFWILFAAQSWALWLIQNKLTIENSFPKQPADCFYKTALFLQLWRPLLKEKHVDKMDIIIGALRALYRQTRINQSQEPTATA
jgi:hypothetical protein